MFSRGGGTAIPSMIDTDEYLDFLPVPLPKHGAPTSAFHH
jgi:hypothetical protein